MKFDSRSSSSLYNFKCLHDAKLLCNSVAISVDFTEEIED